MKHKRPVLLINDNGNLHVQFVDDMSVADSLDMIESWRGKANCSILPVEQYWRERYVFRTGEKFYKYSDDGKVQRVFYTPTGYVCISTEVDVCANCRQKI